MKIEMVPIGKLIAPALEMREEVTREGLDELVVSIKELGILQALRVVRRGDQFEIVAGYRRWTAAKVAGLELLPCEVVADDPRKIEEAKIHENLRREDVNCVDEAHYYKKLVDERDFSLDDIVRMVGKGAAYVEGRFEIARWDEQVKAALQGKHISIAIARELMRFRDVDARGRFLKVAIAHGVTRQTMEAWRMQYEADVKKTGEAGVKGVEKIIGQPLVAAAVFCFHCGVDLRGMVVYYEPLCIRSREYLEAEKGRMVQEGLAGKAPV